VAKASSRSSKIEINSLDTRLHVIGNRGLETVLFELLEDLTMFKSKLDNG